jgi:hypothetical protein
MSALRNQSTWAAIEASTTVSSLRLARVRSASISTVSWRRRSTSAANA